MSEEIASAQPESSVVRLAHLSDVHFGKISHPDIVQSLVDEVNETEMDLVVVSGDLTQRAHDWQYQDAKSMLDALAAPVLVVPGNHDVRQFWHNPIERFFRSTDRYRRWISDDLTPTFQLRGLAAFGLNSAHGRTVKGGRINNDDIKRMRGFFADVPGSDIKVLVVHHHLIKNPEFGRTDIAQNSAETVKAAIESDVDLILCGHYHLSRVFQYKLHGGKIVVVSAGTATSSRGRGDHTNVNRYNWITVDSRQIVIQERTFNPEAVRFESGKATVLER